MRLRSRFVLFSAGLLVFASGVAFGQEYSTKREIAVFRLGYYSFRIPTAALSAIDSQIQDVFVNLGRFTVIGYAQSIEAQDVNQFIDALRKYKEHTTQLPEQVQLGREAFTKADFDRLTGSFVVVVPAVTYYSLEQSRAGDFVASFDTSFTFVDVQNLTTIGQFTLSTNGSGPYPNNAIKAAISGIPLQLSYEVRRMTAFQIKTGVLEVNGGDVIIEFGRNMGVKQGDEYAVITPRIVAGHEVDEQSGLLVVREVKERHSIAHVLYADRTLYVGDQLKEIPRLGVEAEFYSDVIIGYSSSSSASQLSAFPLFGLRATLTRGTYRVRPTVEVEIPFRQALAGGFPTNLFVGVEMFNMYLGRLQLSPTVLLGGGGYYIDNDFYLTHLGGKAEIDASILLARDLKLSVGGGYAIMLGLRSGSYSWEASYGGPFAGVGLTAKF